MSNRAIFSSVVAVVVLVAVGCAPPPPYLRGYRFAPEPALAVMFKPGTQIPVLSVVSTVVGIRRGDPDKGISPAVEVRMRFENNGQEPATFDSASVTMVTGMLETLGPPEVHPPQAVQIAPGQTQNIVTYFPLPPGRAPQSLPLDALRLRWEVTLEGKPYLQTVVFERASELYYGG